MKPMVRFVSLSALCTELPAYQTEGAAGFDLRAATLADIEIAPGAFAMIATGLAVEIPPGFEGQVRPRSGLAAKHGVTVLNAPGTVDCDYRGEVRVCLINHGALPFTVRQGERIAQMIIAPVTQAQLVWAPSLRDLSETVRGAGGYGSTGL